MINFKSITEENFDIIIRMKRPENEHFVASNAYSLAQAWLYRDNNDVYPFAIYNDEEPVGFMMLDEDLARESGKYDFLIIDYAPENKIAEHVYTKLGFKPTGEISNDEIVLRMDL